MEKPEPVELELRLTGDPETLNAIFTSSSLTQATVEGEEVTDLESRYYDTPELDLRAKGIAYRVRANGKGFKQTLKSGDEANAAVLKRGEWETSLEDEQPKLEALPKHARDQIPKAAFKAGLEQAFATRVRRRTRTIALAGPGRIEAALDLGEIETGAGGLPIAEIELELLDGQPAALYELALELQKIGPLRLETRSKSTRAFERLTQTPPPWHRGNAPSLRVEDSVENAMAAIFQSCFDQWVANQAAAIDGRDPEGVHQMRVALRRLRSALSVFRKLIPEDQYVWLNADARRAISALGPARDWDVFQNELLAPVVIARPGDAGLKALGRRARARCQGGYRQARKHLESADYTGFVLRFGHWLEQSAWRHASSAKRAQVLAKPIAGFAGKLLEKRHRQALTKGKNFNELETAKRHELRIAMKKLRYSVEFFKPLYEKSSVKPFLNRVKALQDDLGLLNDVAVAEGLLEDLMARPGKRDIGGAAGVVIGWHARGVAAAEPKLRKDWQGFASAFPFWRQDLEARKKVPH
ncbi:MAG: CYTH and CHAD domain-containing protein [Pseudomonadota bacterium]